MISPAAATELSKKFAELQAQSKVTPVSSFTEMQVLLSAEEWALTQEVVALKPEDYDVHTPFAGELEDVPGNLVKITNQYYTENGEDKIIKDRYVPYHIFEAYTKMNNAFMVKNPSRKLLVGSCYRSPAYQVVVFVWQLAHIFNGDIGKTIRRASPPNYSQHTIASKAAIDFKTVDGLPSEENPENFKQTIEYAWLRKHASEFGFYESWQEGNEFGQLPEPWHWQYLGTK